MTPTRLVPLAALLLVGCSTPPERYTPPWTADTKAQPITVNRLAARPTRVEPVKEPEPEVPVEERVDHNCLALARYARTIATIRDAGVPPTSIWSILGAPPAFPAGPIIREVYARRDISPEVGEVNSYGVCRKQTYQVMLDSLVRAEAEHLAAEARRAADLRATQPAPARR